MPVSDAAARRAADWLEAWARAGLLGSDPEVRAYVCDLIQFVGERAMDEKLVPGEVVGRTGYEVAAEWRDRCKAAEGRARELEADNARLRGLVAELRACDPAYKLAKAVSDFPVGERTMDKDRQQGVPRRIVLVDREDPEDYLEVAQVYGFGAPRVSLFANQEGEVCGVTLGVAEAKTLAAFLLAFAEKEGGDQ